MKMKIIKVTTCGEPRLINISYIKEVEKAPQSYKETPHLKCLYENNKQPSLITFEQFSRIVDQSVNEIYDLIQG